MRGTSSHDVPRYLETLFRRGTVGPLSDEQLLRQFVVSRGEGSESAFAALVERHGAMVLGVCRRVLGNREAAEDAFQATFLVLARKAAGLAHGKQLYRWLYGVALRAALDARARAKRQRARETRVGAMQSVESPQHVEASELRSVLDEELARLPERFRSPLLLCELEGISRKEAAARLGVSEGTLSSRLSRAKAKLRERLTRRGLALSTAVLATFLAQETRGVIVPPLLIDKTIRAGTLVAAGSSVVGVVSAPVLTLTQEVLKMILIGKLKGAALGLAAMALIGTGLTAMAQHAPPQRAAAAPSDDRLKALEQKIDKLIDTLARPSANLPAAARLDNTPVSYFEVGSPTPSTATYGDAVVARSQPLSVEQRVEALERRFEDFGRRLANVEAQLRRTPISARGEALPPAERSQNNVPANSLDDALPKR